MAIGYFLGNTMVSSNEMNEKHSIGIFSRFNKELKKVGKAKIEFRNGSMDSAELYDNTALNIPNRTPIGIGKPMSIEILSIYTGDAPQKMFGGKKDLLVVSGIRSTTTHNEAPRAINQLIKEVDDKQFLEPSAFSKGSPIVYYTPAVDVSTTLCSLEVIADTFSKETFDKIAGLFDKAGSLPVFFTSNYYLLAGSSIVRMAGDLADALFESQTFLKGNIPFRFDTPEVPISMAKQIAIYNDGDERKFKDFAPGLVDVGGIKRPALVHRITKNRYSGDAPYILLSIDGRDRNAELRDFSPKMATTAILDKFYGSDIESKSTEIIETAMELYNDMHYFKKAKDLMEEMKEINANTNEYQRMKTLLEAYQANIRNEQFYV